MRNILINFMTSNTGGVVNFKRSVLREFNNIVEGGTDQYFVLLDDSEARHNKHLKNLRFIQGYNAPQNLVDKVKFYEVTADRITQNYDIDVILNFGDIPAKVDCTQIMYFDWPYAVYNDRSLWSRMNFKEFLSKYLKRLYFWRVVSRCKLIIAQTQTMKDRLLAKNSNLDINIVDVGYDELEAQTCEITTPPKQIKSLIYPTLAYPHKNVEILIDVASKLQGLSRNILFILTFDGSEGSREKLFRAKVEKLGLESFFKFCGRLEREQLVKAIQNSDGMVMPTLIETYGLPYIECQIFNKVMFTSDRDFARELCGESAIYFDPLDPDDIVNAIKNAADDKETIGRVYRKIEHVKRVRISWRESVQQMQKLIDKHNIC